MFFSLEPPRRGDSNEYIQYIIFNIYRGWSGGAMVLGKLSVPGRPISLGITCNGARAYCACSRVTHCGPI